MISVKIERMGDAVGLPLPDSVLSDLGAKAGDTLYLTPQPDGSFLLSTRDPKVALQVAAAEAFMREYDETFRALAK